MNSFIAKVSFLKRATLLDKSKLQLLLKTFQEFHRNELYYVDGKRCSSSQLNFMSTLFLIHSRCVYEDDFFTWHLIGTFINTKTRAVHFFPLHDSFHADILIWTQFIRFDLMFKQVFFLEFESNSKWFSDDDGKNRLPAG